MVFGDVAWDDFNIPGFAGFTKKLRRGGYISKDQWFMAVWDNTARLLKSSPEGQAFLPIPEEEHKLK